MTCVSSSPITVVLSSDNTYIPYVAVTIQSLCEYASAQHTYEIYILCETIAEKNKEKILGMQKPHIRIAFLSIKEYLDSVDVSSFYLPSYPTLATYYRIFIPEIFADREKVLYLDCDVVVCKDVADIFQYEMGEACIAAIHDYGVRIRYFQKTRIHTYIDTVLCVDVQQYFQAGVLLFAVQNMRKQNFLQKCLVFMSSHPDPVFADQDVLNKICEASVLYLPWKYNVLWHIPLLEKEALAHFTNEDVALYTEAMREPAIIHYSSSCKPWHFPHLPLADVFWQVAQQTPFAEEIKQEAEAAQKKLEQEIRFYPLIFALSCFWKVVTFFPFKPLKAAAFRRHTKYRLMVIGVKRAKRLQAGAHALPQAAAKQDVQGRKLP